MMPLKAKATIPRAIAFGLFAYAAFLLVLAPATLIDAGMDSASAGRLRLAQAQGTLWSGVGQLELRDASGRRGAGRPLSWRLRPASLLRARLGYDVTLASADRSFSLDVFPFGVEIAEAEFVVPAAMLAFATPRLALLDPNGDLHIGVSRLSIKTGAIHGEAVVSWPDAGSSLTPVWPLGDYELRLAGDDGGTKAVLRTLKGALQLDGEGYIGASTGEAFRATARMQPRHRPELEPLLRMIAVERSEGVFELQLDQGIGRIGSSQGSGHRP